MTTTTMTKTRTAKRERVSAGAKKAVQTRAGGKKRGCGSERDETAYLLQSPANAEHLCQAIAELDAGKGIEVGLEEL